MRKEREGKSGKGGKGKFQRDNIGARRTTRMQIKYILRRRGGDLEGVSRMQTTDGKGTRVEINREVWEDFSPTASLSQRTAHLPIIALSVSVF